MLLGWPPGKGAWCTYRDDGFAQTRFSVLVEHHASTGRRRQRIAVEWSGSRQKHESTARLLDAQVAVSQHDVILFFDDARRRDRVDGGRGERRLDRKADGEIEGHALTNAVAVPHAAQPLTLIRACDQTTRARSSTARRLSF